MKFKLRIIVFIIVIAFILSGVFYLTRKNGLRKNFVDVKNHYNITLIPFKEPVLIGFEAPPINPIYKKYLNAYDIASNPSDYTYEEAFSVATKEVTSKLNREKYSLVQDINKKNPAYTQSSVDYLINITNLTSHDKYLIVGYRSGHHKNSDISPTGRGISPLYYQNKIWKACGFLPEIRGLNEKLDFTDIVKIEKLLISK